MSLVWDRPSSDPDLNVGYLTLKWISNYTQTECLQFKRQATVVVKGL